MAGKIIFEWWILQQAALDYRSVPWVLDGFSRFVRWKWSSCGKKWLELQANLVFHPLHVFLDEISTSTAEIPDFVCKRHVHLRDFWDSNASPTNMIQNAGLTMYSIVDSQESEVEINALHTIAMHNLCERFSDFPSISKWSSIMKENKCPSHHNVSPSRKNSGVKELIPQVFI